MKFQLHHTLWFLLLAGAPALLFCQTEPSSELAGTQVQSRLTREQCIDYALANQPAYRNLLLEDSIARLNNEINLAAWKPTLAATAGLTNNWKQQVSIFPDFMNPGQTREVVLGQRWTSNLGIRAGQLLYSPEIIRDRNLQEINVQTAALQIAERRLEVKAQVSQAFFRALRFTESIALSRADIERLERNLRDARLLFDNGLNDKVDYKRATIALNQARAQLATALLGVDSRLADLKTIMGYPIDRPLELRYAYDEYARQVLSDSLTNLKPEERPAVRNILVQQQRQDLTTGYLRNAWLPTVSASAAYNFNWFGNNFGNLYNRKFPAGLVSLTANVPIFNGGRRFRQIELATVLRRGLDLELESLRNQINNEYVVATNDYRSSRLNFLVAEENVALAREIYEVVRLQYREGIEPFLEVVIAENDLRSSQNRALNALIDALIDRVEVARATATL